MIVERIIFLFSFLLTFSREFVVLFVFVRSSFVPRTHFGALAHSVSSKQRLKRIVDGPFYRARIMTSLIVMMTRS